MLRKILNFTKKGDFFLELDENEDLDIVDKAKSVATKAKEKTTQIVEEVKETVIDSQTAEKAKSETKEFAQKAKEKTAETASKIVEQSSKESEKTATDKSEKEDTAKSEKEAAKPVAVDTSYSEEPFWVKLMYKTSEQKEAEEQAEKTFATDYLITKPKSRRRPGGSLDKFKTMASQTKTKI